MTRLAAPKPLLVCLFKTCTNQTPNPAQHLCYLNIVKSKQVIYIALAADVVITITKFIGSGISGSTAMLSEGIHSFIDCLSQLLLIWGLYKSQQKPDSRRPFGYGRELYFWAFIVSLMVFVAGGCISFYKGLQQIKHPALSGNGTWSYVVLGVAFVFTAVSAYSSLRLFNKQRGEIPFWEAIRESKDPVTFIILLSDVGDLLGLPVAFVGIWLGHTLHNAYYDGAAALVIGLILILISMVLVRESWSLLMGEAPNERTMKKIVALAEKDEAVAKVKQHLSTYLAPEDVVLQLITVFKDDLDTRQITEAIERISKEIKQKFPRIKRIFIEPVAP